jgi:hypothetical protein
VYDAFARVVQEGLNMPLQGPSAWLLWAGGIPFAVIAAYLFNKLVDRPICRAVRQAVSQSERPPALNKSVRGEGGPGCGRASWVLEPGLTEARLLSVLGKPDQTVRSGEMDALGYQLPAVTGSEHVIIWTKQGVVLGVMTPRDEERYSAYFPANGPVGRLR